MLKHNYFLYILYIWTGTIIVELMGILCFDWYIFMYIARRQNYTLMMFVETLFGVWVCWTYILLIIVLNYFRLSITNQFLLFYNIFSYFFTWILDHIFSFYSWIMIFLVFFKIKRFLSLLHSIFFTWTLWIVVVELFINLFLKLLFTIFYV